MVETHSRSASRHRSLVASAVMAAALFAGAPAGPAQAFHIPGAVYTGTHGGPYAPPPPPESGIVLSPPSVEVDVSPDGSSVTRLRITNVGGESCGVAYSQTTSTIPIVNHSFSFSGGGNAWAGTFQSVRSVQGTFRSTSSSCLTPTVSWTATTSASPAGSEECKNAKSEVTSAQTAVRKAEKTVKKAKKRLKKADSSTEKKKAKQQLKMSQKRLKKAKQRLQDARAQQTAVCG